MRRDAVVAVVRLEIIENGIVAPCRIGAQCEPFLELQNRLVTGLDAGRIATVRTEVETDPDDWRRWYRLARAYDYAGDRRRAREAMRTALELHRAPQAGR